MFKYFNALFCIRMGTEQRAEETCQTRCEVLRMYDEQLGDVIALDVFEPRVARYFAKGGGEGERIAAQFGTAGVGHVLAFARDGKAREQREEVSHGATQGGDDEHYEHRQAARAVVLVVGRAVAHAAEPEGVVHHLHYEAHDG